LYYDANITFRILAKTIQGFGAGAQNKNQKQPELSLKFRTVAGATAISEVAPARDPFLDTNGVTDFVSAIKQNVSIDLWQECLCDSNKIVGLDLGPFSEMVENHCCWSKKNVNTTTS